MKSLLFRILLLAGTCTGGYVALTQTDAGRQLAQRLSLPLHAEQKNDEKKGFDLQVSTEAVQEFSSEKISQILGLATEKLQQNKNSTDNSSDEASTQTGDPTATPVARQIIETVVSEVTKQVGTYSEQAVQTVQYEYCKQVVVVYEQKNQ